MATETDEPGWRTLWDVGCTLGEGPVWVAREAALYFVDIEAPAVHRYDPVTGERFSWTPPCRVGSLAPRAGGGFIAGTEQGFAHIDPVAGVFEPIDHPELHLPTNRFNDGKVDPSGAFWAGTMDDRKTARQGTLYRVDAGGWAVADTGYRITNGPAFSPDGRTAYHSDTLDSVTFAFDLGSDGSLSNKRDFARWPAALGVPDGMTVDAEGYLWVAFWGGWAVRRVSAAGEIVGEFALPASNITSCAFGGANLDRLFVTCARQGLDAAALAAQPLAGALFEILGHGARGCPPVEYAA